MLPNWLEETDNYQPLKDHNQFIYMTLKSISSVMSKIRMQKGHEKSKHVPSILKLLITILLIIIISITQNYLVLLAISTIVLVYLCSWPSDDLLHLFKSSLLAVCFSVLIFLPAMLINSSAILNYLRVIFKVFISILIINIFNHTTQWNHVTSSLKTIHVPTIFIFTLDITLKYIILLGNVILNMLTALQLRSVGKNNKQYQSIGGIMGVTFIKGIELNQQMYEAMVCRCFSDDYKGL